MSLSPPLVDGVWGVEVATGKQLWHYHVGPWETGTVLPAHSIATSPALSLDGKILSFATEGLPLQGGHLYLLDISADSNSPPRTVIGPL